MVEARGVEPLSENVTSPENYMLSRAPARALPERSLLALRADKKREQLAC